MSDTVQADETTANVNIDFSASQTREVLEDSPAEQLDRNADLEMKLKEMKALIDEQRLLQAELKSDLIKQRKGAGQQNSNPEYPAYVAVDLTPPGPRTITNHAPDQSVDNDPELEEEMPSRSQQVVEYQPELVQQLQMRERDYLKQIESLKDKILLLENVEMDKTEHQRLRDRELARTQHLFKKEFQSYQ